MRSAVASRSPGHAVAGQVEARWGAGPRPAGWRRDPRGTRTGAPAARVTRHAPVGGWRTVRRCAGVGGRRKLRASSSRGDLEGAGRARGGRWRARRAGGVHHAVVDHGGRTPRRSSTVGPVARGEVLLGHLLAGGGVDPTAAVAVALVAHEAAQPGQLGHAVGRQRAGGLELEPGRRRCRHGPSSPHADDDDQVGRVERRGARARRRAAAGRGGAVGAGARAATASARCRRRGRRRRHSRAAQASRPARPAAVAVGVATSGQLGPAGRAWPAQVAPGARGRPLSSTSRRPPAGSASASARTAGLPRRPATSPSRPPRRCAPRGAPRPARRPRRWPP